MEYEIIVGLEIHCELKTATKCFCSCKNQFGAPINNNVCPVCFGLPGALPSINKKALEFAIKAGLAFESDIVETAVFERKNYFYPDLPKAYQISQLRKNVCNGGKIAFSIDGKDKVVRLDNIHLEEDAAKSIHDPLTNTSMVDYNRSGVPLIEIVTKPDIRSAEEAVATLEQIRQTLTYIEVSDCKMQEGQLRCDVNLSVRKKGETIFNNRTEMKNINSFKAVARAINFEAQRQIDILENGGTVSMDSLKWDDENNCNYVMRSKQTEDDYKYFPDPDIPEIEIPRSYVEKIRKNLPVLPEKRKKYYIEILGLPEFNANVLIGRKEISDYFEKCLEYYNNPKIVSNWVMSDILRLLKEELLLDEVNIRISPENLTNIIKMVENKQISQNASKEVLDEMWLNDEPCEIIVERLGLKQVNNADELDGVVEEVITENPQAVQDFKDGNTKIVTFFMGQIMKKTRGKANPQIINKLIIEKLNKM